MEQEQRGLENRNIHEPLPVNFERIPARIRGMRQFVVWRFVQVEDELKKPPFDPKTGRIASVAKESTWGSLAQARRAYDTGDYKGIGIVLTQTLGVVGIDIDHCIKDTGQLAKIWPKTPGV